MAEALNLAQLASELEVAGSPWEMDPETSMAQLTEDERRQRLGFHPPPGEPSLEQAAATFESTIPKTDVELQAELAVEAVTAPAAFDLRDVNGSNFTTPVKNQGGCGSCVAFGVAAVLETTLKRGLNKPNLAIDLSEAHLFYCHAAGEGRNCGNGWWPENGLKKAHEIGVTTEQYFPYTAGDQACNLGNGWRNSLAISTGQTRASSRTEMKEWISKRGSLAACFIVYQDFFSYRSGVYKHISGAQAGGHCVEIVGYDDAQGCWVCKNSWGTGWGEGGYFKIAYGQCAIETWAGPWGSNGVRMRQWVRNARVSALWTNNQERNAHAYLAGNGWRKLTPASSAAQHAMLANLVGAKTAHRRVDALEYAGVLEEIYVI